MKEKTKSIMIIYIVVSIPLIMFLHDIKVENDIVRDIIIYQDNSLEFSLFESSIVTYHDILVKLCNEYCRGNYKEALLLYEDILKVSSPLDYYETVNPKFKLNVREINKIIVLNLNTTDSKLFEELIQLEVKFPNAFDKKDIFIQFMTGNSDVRLKLPESFVNYSNEINLLINMHGRGDDYV